MIIRILRDVLALAALLLVGWVVIWLGWHGLAAGLDAVDGGGQAEATALMTLGALGYLAHWIGTIDEEL